MTPPEPEPEEERRFVRYDPRTRRRAADDDDYDPDEETVFSGLRTLRASEVALFLAAIITSLLIWLIFIWIHRGSPSAV